MTDTEISPADQDKSNRAFSPRAALQAVFQSFGRMALVYLVALTAAEAMTTLLEARLGMIMHGIVLVVIILHSALWAKPSERLFLISLALAPLIRLMSLSLPLPDFSFVYWYMIVGSPLFVAAIVTARLAGLTRENMGLTMNKWPAQLLIGLVGIGLGFIEYLILRPKSLVSVFSFTEILIPAFILLIFTGFLEELIFRGIMQFTAAQNFGTRGVIYVAIVFAVLHIGYKSVLDVLFVLGATLIFSWFTIRTKSIVGVTIAHGLTNIGLFLVFPFLLN